MIDEPRYLESSVKTQFTLLTIFWWLGWPLSAIGAFVLPIEVVGAMCMAVLTVFWCILLYRQWLLLQGHGARTTPARAVGFGFIPIFWFYWWFVAYVGLATDTNRYLEQLGINTYRMSRPMAITDCILSVLLCTIGLYPPIGAVLTLPGMIVGYILIVQQRNCVLAMLNAQQAQTVSCDHSESSS